MEGQMRLSDVLDYIDLYLFFGFCIIPIVPRSKKAAIKWKEYQERRPTDEEISKWIKLWEKGYNVGIICGGVSDNLVVLDLDCYEAPESLEVFDVEKFAERTLVAKTPSGGYHIYLRTKAPCPSFNISARGKTIVEVRGVGRYILAPPSEAINKRTGEVGRYEFLPGCPEEVVTISDYLPAVLPKKVGEKLGVEISTAYDSQTGDRLLDLHGLLAGKPYRGKPPPCIQFILKGLPMGMRNEGCVRLASYLLHFRRLRPETVLRKLLEWNAKNRPPLPEREVRAAFESVLKHGYLYGCQSLRQFGCNRAKCNIRPLRPITEDDWW